MLKVLIRKGIVLLFWLAVVFSLVLTIFTISVKYTLPYLDYYRPQIESNLSQIMGYPVTLDQIDGQLEGIDPTVSVAGIRLTVAGQPAVLIDELRVRLDTVKSLLTLTPKFAYIRFIHPNIALQETSGNWRLAGAQVDASKNTSVGVERILDYLASQQNFSVLDTKVSIDSELLGSHSLISPGTYIVKQQAESLLTSSWFVDGAVSPIKLNASISKPLSLFHDYDLTANVSLPAIELPNSLPFFEQFPDLSKIALAGELWLNMAVGESISLQLENTNFALSFGEAEYELEPRVKLEANLLQPSLRVDVQSLALSSLGNENTVDSNLVVQWSGTTESTNVRFDQMDLAATNEFARHFLNPEWQVSQILSGLQPTGLARNAALKIWQDEQEIAFHYLSNLNDASVQGYSGIPKATGINGVFSLTQSGGYIDFTGHDSALSFDTVYDSVWQTDDLSGYVKWQNLMDHFLITGEDLSVTRNGALIQGGFRLEVRDWGADWFALDLHADQLSAEDRLTFVPPNALGEELRQWVDEAFNGEGVVEQADFMINTELVDGAQPIVRLQMKLADTDIRFDENWPQATNVKGTFNLAQEGVSVFVESVDFADFSTTDVLVQVPIVDGQADRLIVKGSVDKEAQKVLAFLNDTPLAEDILQPFSDWELRQPVKGQFNVAVPFDQGDPSVDLEIHLNNNPLRMNDLDLNLSVVKGQLYYQTDQGVYDSVFEVDGLGGRSVLELSSSVAENDKALIITGHLQGSVGLQEVAGWSLTPVPHALLDRFNGVVDYQGELAINQAQQGQLDLTLKSDLVGGDIGMPSPVGKPSQEARQLVLTFRQHDDDLVIDEVYGQLVRSRFLIRDSELIGGEYFFNKDQPLSSTIPKGLVFKGEVSEVDFDPWFEVINYFIEEVNQSDSDETASLFDIPEWLSQAELIVDNFKINEQNTLHNAKLVYPSKQGSLQVNSDEINLELSQKAGAPHLHFGFLSWESDPAEPTEEEKSTPILHANQIPTMGFSIDELYLDHRPLGDWQMQITNLGDRLRIDPLSTRLETASFDGSLFWQDDGISPNVELMVAVKGEDLAELTGKFSKQPLVTSEEYDINLALSWQGHPFYFDRSSASGRINFSALDGNFSQVEELPAFLKVLGIFNFGALSRRLSLDFSDVYEPGFTYDEFTGKLLLNQGVVTTQEPIKVTSPTANVIVQGSANIESETLDQEIEASFPISGALPLAGLIWATPQIAGLLYITDQLVGDKISKITSVKYLVNGSFDEPVFKQVQYQPNARSDK
ncbi:YhdP family phospholipid transporter [Marinomonas epiphytica]